jgi:hypothetical protein
MTTSTPTALSERVASRLPQCQPGSDGNRRVWTATGLEPQIFVDRSGRRALTLRWIVTILASIALSGPATLIAGATGFSTLPAVQLVGTRAPHTVFVATFMPSGAVSCRAPGWRATTRPRDAQTDHQPRCRYR